MAKTQTTMRQQWRGHLTLPSNSILTVQSDDKEELVKVLQRASGDDGLEFNQSDPMTFVIFHSRWNSGNTPLGYINQIRVPDNLSIQNLTEHRLGELKAA